MTYIVRTLVGGLALGAAASCSAHDDAVVLQRVPDATDDTAHPVDAMSADDDAAPVDSWTGSDDGDASAADAGVTIDAPSSPITYVPTLDFLLNPERGFYVTADLATTRDLSSVRADNKTLVYAAVHLDHYLGTNHAQDLPAQVLDDVRAGFTAVRQAGVKAIVRFQYDDGEGYPGGANDAPESWIVRTSSSSRPCWRTTKT